VVRGSSTVELLAAERPTTSDSRTCCLSSVASARSTSSPIRWPVAVVDPLEVIDVDQQQSQR